MELDKRQIRAIFITGISILLLLLLFLILGIVFVTNSNNKNKDINISSGFNSIQEIVEHYNCRYKNETYKEKREYPTEINLVFSKKLYENDTSNEEFFNNIIEDVAKFIKYTNFKMVDTETHITINVVCENGKINQIVINDIEDYFVYMDSQLEITKYEEIDTISLLPDANVLNYLIENNWSTDANFGTRESIFKNYNIYFDEGTKFRKIGSSIYNVIFTEKYFGPVVNNIQVGATLSAVKDRLGKPAFEDEDLDVIGYKGKDIYVFFTKNEISIYKNKRYDYKEFWKLADEFLEEDMEFKEFMNELTYIWTDHSEYTYSSDYMFMSYPNRGVEIKLNYDGMSGIILYNNLSDDLSTIKKYLNHTEFISRLNLDSVFEAEKRRVKEEKDFAQECIDLEKDEETKSMLFYKKLEKDTSGQTVKVCFSSKNGEYPNRELNEPVATYVWISDNHFVYSLYRKGIYDFDVITGEKTVIVENADEEYNIEKFMNDVLTYDGREVVLEY